jgi:hypothetical protein
MRSSTSASWYFMLFSKTAHPIFTTSQCSSNSAMPSVNICNMPENSSPFSFSLSELTLTHGLNFTQYIFNQLAVEPYRIALKQLDSNKQQIKKN